MSALKQNIENPLRTEFLFSSFLILPQFDTDAEKLVHHPVSCLHSRYHYYHYYYYFYNDARWYCLSRCCSICNKYHSELMNSDLSCYHVLYTWMSAEGYVNTPETKWSFLGHQLPDRIEQHQSLLINKFHQVVFSHLWLIPSYSPDIQMDE